MLEFLFMLTKNDTTIEDCLEIYDEVRDSGLRWVGFKDVGVPFSTLEQLTRRIQADDRKAVLEIVSVSAASELASARAATELGVDLLMGGTRPNEVTRLLADTSIRYFPFAGRITGHPSVLEGTLEEITENAREITALARVDGLDLLAYRWAGDVPRLMEAVVAAASGPVVIAGSIATAEQIRAAANAGAWGFTIGGAALDRALVPGGSTRDQVDHALAAAMTSEARARFPG